jgi:casein kinase 1
MKEKIDTKQLCENLPIEFTRYFDYVKKLNFKQAPEYK